MEIKTLTSTITKVSLALCFGLCLASCSTKEAKHPQDVANIPASDTGKPAIQSDTNKKTVGFNKAKKVFYSLPSPIESAMLLKRSGAKYDSEIANKPFKVNDYNTTQAMALNLGIYTADLSYASLFEQAQTSVNYMAVSKKLADNLGILNIVNDSIVSQLEENVSNPYVSAGIISEMFMNSSSALKEDKRAEVAAVVIVGAWIEGLYLATQLTQKSMDNNQALVAKIVDQRLSLDAVVSLLEEYKSKSIVSSLMPDIYILKGIFEEIEVSQSNIVPRKDEERNITILESESSTNISQATFLKLYEKVSEIRSKYVQ